MAATTNRPFNVVIHPERLAWVIPLLRSETSNFHCGGRSQRTEITCLKLTSHRYYRPSAGVILQKRKVQAKQPKSQPHRHRALLAIIFLVAEGGSVGVHGKRLSTAVTGTVCDASAGPISGRRFFLGFAFRQNNPPRPLLLGFSRRRQRRLHSCGDSKRCWRAGA